jgi:hypothetical protein
MLNKARDPVTQGKAQSDQYYPISFFSLSLSLSLSLFLMPRLFLQQVTQLHSRY